LETFLREHARYPAQVALGRPHVKLTTAAHHNMVCKRKSKELRDKLEEGVKKHEEKAQVVARRMTHNAEMGSVEAQRQAMQDGRAQQQHLSWSQLI